jgi:hypothetical protein
MSEKIELLKSLGFSEEFINSILNAKQYSSVVDSFATLPKAIVFDSLDTQDILISQSDAVGVTDKMNISF